MIAFCLGTAKPLEPQSMIIDFHTHIFPGTIRKNRAAYFKGETAFSLLYSSPKSKLAGAGTIVSAMDEQGVDRSVVFGFPWKDISICRMHNDYISEAVQRFPRRLIGFCCVDPFHPGAVAEVERCLKGGLSGVGELAFYESGFTRDSIEQLAPLLALCREADLPVLIHTNEPVGHAYPGKSPMTLGELYRLVQAFPDNKIVLAHWGGGLFFYHLMRKEVKAALSNVYVDTAASPYLYDTNIYRIAIEIFGAEKILFGSDYPLLPPERYFSQMHESGLSTLEIQQVSGETAARLLKLY
jgi:predicted TIM-barrel fold metal-dependent hydrolase